MEWHLAGGHLGQSFDERDLARGREASAESRKAAVAYVTKDLVGLRAGDVLITDASTRAIRSGQTDAPLLKKMHENGVTIYSHEGLHSKVILLGRYAVVGSANMSGSEMTEVSVITDNPNITSGNRILYRSTIHTTKQVDEEADRSPRKNHGCPHQMAKSKRPIEGKNDSSIGQHDLDHRRE